MSRRVAALLMLPAMLLAADSLAQSEDDYPPPPPPPETYDPPVSDTPPTPDSDAPRTEADPRGKHRDRGRSRGRNRDRVQRDVAAGLTRLIVGEILEEIEEQPRSRPRGCTYERAGGWMQPTQGVYLDDPDFDFINWGGANSPNPQLVQVNPWGVYDALLPMVAGRAIALVGAIEYRDDRGNKTKTGADRSGIVIKGRGNCSTRRPVKVRFTVTDAEGSRVVYETPQLPDLLPLEGPRKRDMEDFAVSVPAADGLPPLDSGAFTLRGAHGSPYSIKASIIRADTNTPTNLEVEVRGRIHATHGLTVQFVPLMLSRNPKPGDEANLRAYTRDLASESWLRIPDVFPIRHDQLTTFTGDTVDLSRLDPGQLPPDHPNYRSPAQNMHPKDGPTPRQAMLMAIIADYLGTRSHLSLTDRTVAVVRWDDKTGDEFEWIVTAAGVAIDTKVAAVPAPVAAFAPPRDPVTGRSQLFPDARSGVQTVAHELTHILPRYAFSSAEMDTQCGRDFHNNLPNLGTGLQLTAAGRPFRKRHDRISHMMGSHTNGEWWIGQCDYAHLIGALALKPDPELWLVRAIVSRTRGRAAAELKPGYDMMGVADLSPGETGTWSVRLRDEAGRQIADWPFEPNWTVEGQPRDIAPIQMRVPAMTGARRLEIVQAGRVVASRAIPAQAPSLQVATPTIARDRRSVHLRWKARSQAGGALLSTVCLSSNGGAFFDCRLFEQNVTQAIVRLDPGAPNQAVKVVVTDGARSAEQTMRIP